MATAEWGLVVSAEQLDDYVATFSTLTPPARQRARRCDSCPSAHACSR